MKPERRSRSTEAFYGRRHGKTLRPMQRAALEGTLPAYLLDLSQAVPEPVERLFEASVKEVRLEIGFGGGERLFAESGRLPRTGFIGVEPFVNGMAKLMTALDMEPRGNLRVYDDDATRLLDWLPAGSIDVVELLYPDPWPKRRHWKRRFVNRVNLDRIARILKIGGEFRFASDIGHYVNWTLAHCGAHEAFAWRADTARDWRDPFEGWVRTRYEAKAETDGRRPAYLRFGRI